MTILNYNERKLNSRVNRIPVTPVQQEKSENEREIKVAMKCEIRNESVVQTSNLKI